MVNKLTFNFAQIGKQLTFFEQSKAKFAGKRALTRFGRDLKKKDIKEQYEKVLFIGKKAVRFTTNSTFTLQKGLRMKVGVKDEVAMDNPTKGNPAAKYLFPVLGGGSRQAYETLFIQHLQRGNYMNDGQYPEAVFDGLAKRFMKRKSSNGRPTNTVLQNTLIALGKTKDGSLTRRNRGNAKIQDARVIAFKEDKKIGKGKTYRAGIYRQITQGRGKKSKVFLAPLFMYKDVPNVGRKTTATFESIVTKLARKKIGKLWIEEAKMLARTNQ